MIKRFIVRSAAIGAAMLLAIPAGAVNAEPASASPFTLTSYDEGDLTSIGTHSKRSADSGSTTGNQILQSATRGSAAIVDTSFADGESGTRFMIAAEPESVTLSWDSVPNVKEYFIYRDNVEIASTINLEYVDKAVRPGVDYEYRIEALSTSESGGAMFGSLAYTPQTNDAASIATEPRSQSLLAGTERTGVIYLTHIPEARVDVPAVGCSYGSGYEFGGDNRGWFDGDRDIYSQSSKTWVSSGTDWTSGGTGSGAQHIGPTRVYDKATGSLVAQKTASFEDDPVRVLDSDVSTSLDLRFQVRAANPFCTGTPFTPYIEGTFTIMVKKAGSWQIISGNHKLMPNHEIVITRDFPDYTRTTKSIYRAVYANPTCLVNGVCEKQNMTGQYGYWK